MQGKSGHLTDCMGGGVALGMCEVQTRGERRSGNQTSYVPSLSEVITGLGMRLATYRLLVR